MNKNPNRRSSFYRNIQRLYERFLHTETYCKCIQKKLIHFDRGNFKILYEWVYYGGREITPPVETLFEEFSANGVKLSEFLEIIYTIYRLSHNTQLYPDRGKRLTKLETTLKSAAENYSEKGKHEELLQFKLLQMMEMVDEHVLISKSDLNGNITGLSEAFAKASGYEVYELMGKNHRIFRHEDMSESVFKEMWETIKRGEVWSGEIKNRRKDGSIFWAYSIISPEYDIDGNHIGYIAIRQDITDKKIIEKMAVTDRLTGLYNRIKLDEVFAAEIERCRRYKQSLSIILMDLDRFKSVNDNYGHQVGDKVLVETAELLKAHVRISDTVGRWGGEEFLILCPETKLDDALGVAEKLRMAIEKYTFPVVGSKTGSFGVSCFLEGDNEDSMVSRADEALYDAKKCGRNQVRSK